MSTTEIVAAGGIVINENGDVLLVHRPRYDDWSFPKGKADAGEEVSETALREVREEAGLSCQIVRQLAEIRYEVTTRKGEVRPKVVHYFLMRAAGGDLTGDGQETDEVIWCSVEEAAAKLSYAADRDLLRRLAE